MYQFSRAIYRELAPQILAPPPGAPPFSNHAAVLRACEEVITRMATDRHYFARPARTLFCDIRNYFPMSAQARRSPRHLPLHRLRAAVPGRTPARGLHGGQRRTAAVPRDDAQGRGLPAHAAAAQRLLPVAPAPRRHRGSRAGGGVGALRRSTITPARPMQNCERGQAAAATYSERRGGGHAGLHSAPAGGQRHAGEADRPPARGPRRTLRTQ